MLKFNVSLNKKDVKRFIIYNMGIFKIKFVIFLVIYLSISIFCYVNLLLFKATLSYLLGFLLFFSFLIFNIFKLCGYFKNMFIKSLDIINKKRVFFVDEHSLNIIYEKDSSLCGRYFFYDLKKYKIFKDILVLYFSDEKYIIIPLKFLKKEEKYVFLKILDKNLNWREICE